MPDELRERKPAVREHAGHIRADERIEEECEHDADHRKPDDAARRLDDEHDAGRADHEIGA